MVSPLVSLVLRYNLRSLSVRSADAFMTLFGIALASAVVVIVGALGDGIERAFVASGSDAVAVLTRRGAKTEVQGRIDLEQANLVGSLEGIEGAPSREVVVFVNLPLRDTGRSSNVLVRGLDDRGRALRPKFRLTAGRPSQPGTSEVIVARRMAERFKGLGLGESFTFGRFQFQVVGTFEAGGTSDSEVWAPCAEVQAAFDRNGVFSSVRVELGGAADAQRAASLARLEGQLAQHARLPLRIERETDYYRSQEESASEVPKMLGRLLAFFMAIGASFGAMNSMFGRIAGRTREIATLRAIGYGRGTIVLAFLLESTALAVAGGLLGVLLALPIHGMGGGTSSVLTLSEVAFTFRVTESGVASALALAASIGLLGGLLPALRASRLAIPEGLRDL